MEEPLNIRYARAAAARLGCTTEVIDAFSHNLIRISSGERFAFVGAGAMHSYPINNSTVAGLATDKTHSYSLLERLGILVPKSRIVFLSDRFLDLRPPGRELDDGRAFAAALGYPVFVKPNEGSRGVFAQSVGDEIELNRHLVAIGQRFESAVIQECLRGEERRIFYIDGLPIFTYIKTMPVVVADGALTVDQLLQRIDEKGMRVGLMPANRDDPVLRGSLARHGLDLDSVAPAGLEIPYSEKANVSGGGGVTGFRQEFTPAETELCRLIYRNTGLRLCAIDLIETDRGRIVLELNASPALNSLEKLGKTELLLEIWTSVIGKAVLA